MASVNKLVPFILKWEGGFVDDPLDRGGATNMGITIGTWKKFGYDKNGDGVIDVKDLKLLEVKDFTDILKKRYWDKWKADNIDNQAIANTLVDWYWHSGSYGIKIPQRVLGTDIDGIVGKKTLEKVNTCNKQEFLNALYQERKEFFLRITKSNPSQKRFIKGWLNRVNDLIGFNKKYI